MSTVRVQSYVPLCNTVSIGRKLSRVSHLFYDYSSVLYWTRSTNIVPCVFSTHHDAGAEDMVFLDGIVTYCVTIVSDPPGLTPLSLARERMEPEQLRTCYVRDA
jgi:hypothetical protein